MGGLSFGVDDLLSIPTGGLYSAVKQGANLTGNPIDLGEGLKDYSNAGKNRYNATPYQPNDIYWGGREGAAGRIAGQGFSGMGGSLSNADWANQQAQRDRGAMATENPELSQRETDARYGDQAGALQLSREAAMGQSPSEAALLMQQGLNQASANQASMAGSARGSAALATAQGNAAGATAGLQNQAYLQGGALRAQEMANARGQYGQLSSQVRDQDLQRLGQGNQMSQFNAGLNDQYRLGMGQLGNQYGQQGLGWYQAAQNPYNQQAQMDLTREGMAADSYNQANMVNAGVSQANADQSANMRDRWTEMGLNLFNTGSQAAANGIGGSKP